ncbi:MAG: DNA-binding protein HU [Bacteroidetes bacterium ADurb.Bin028]|nr:MAG: DNA-binding protein HU [Bacteroidetes bacterium ADurb.Bin028]
MKQNKINKIDLINKISETVNISKKQIEKVLDSLLENITDGLKAGKTVNLVGFGSFMPKKRHARNGVNPQNPKQKIHIPEIIVAKFRTGKALKDALKNKR